MSADRRSTTNHPSDYYLNARRRSSGNSQATDEELSRFSSDKVDGNASIKIAKCKLTSKELKKTVIPQKYSHPVGSKPVRRRFERAMSGSYDDESSIVTHAKDVVKDRSTLSASTPNLSQSQDHLKDRTALLRSHKFGSIFEDEEIGEPLRERARSFAATGEELFIDDSGDDFEADAWGSEFDSDSCDSIEGFFMPLSTEAPSGSRDVVDICFEPQNSIDIEAEEGIDDVADYVWNSAKHPPPKLPSPPAGLARNDQKRRCIVEEIIEKENSYVETLRILSEDYESELRKGKQNLISKEDREVIFCRISKLLELHRSFQISLEDVAATWDENQQIGSVFVARFSSANVRRVYSRYVINYNNARERLTTLLETKRPFAAFIDEKKQSNRRKLSLKELLAYPVQKFPQYILLLKTLLDKTPEDHHDYYSLQQALSNIEGLAGYLNDRRNESEQRLEARTVMKELKRQFCMLDQKQHLKLLDRISVKCLNYSSDGTLSSRRTQELLLFNMMIMCCSKNVRGELKLEWAEQLHKVFVKQDSITPDMKYSVRKDSLGQFMISSHDTNFLSNGTDTARSRMSELQSLIHDQTILKQINMLASTLKYHYDGLEIHNLHSISAHLDKLIQQKTDENRLIDSSQLILEANTNNGESSGETYIFELQSSEKRNKWIEMFMQAKLAQDSWNHNTWYLLDSSAMSSNPMAHQPNIPLLISGMTADLSRNLGEVNCAVPVCLTYGNILKRHLWCCHANAGVTILSVYNHTPTILQNFRYETDEDLSFWCVEVVPGHMQATDIRYQADMVWIGTSSNFILIYSLLEEERHRPICEIETESQVVSLCFFEDRVYAGLLNGYIRVYARDDTGCWLTDDPIEVGYNPVVKIARIPNRNAVLAACDNKLVRINIDEGRFVLEPIELDPPHDADTDGHVQDFAVGEVTAWVAFQESLTIQLIYLRTHRSIQSVHLSRTLASLKSKAGVQYEKGEEDSITCINVVEGCLLIGTRMGFICKVHVTTQKSLKSSMLQSNSPCAVALHKHTGPVRFITAFQNLIEKFFPSMTLRYEKVEGSNTLFKENDSTSSQRTLTSDDVDGNGPYGDEVDPQFVAEQLESKVRIRRQVSMAPVEAQPWLSTPNLLLNRQIKDRPALPLNQAYAKLSFINGESMESVASSTASKSPFRKLSREIVYPPSSESVNHKSSRTKLNVDSERNQILMEGMLIVTGGLGYRDIDKRCHEISKDEASIMCWCVK